MKTHTFHLLAGTFVTLSFVYSSMLLTQAGVMPKQIEGLVIPRVTTTTPKWKTIGLAQLESGATIPAATNVIFRLPGDMKPIPRLTLFGDNSKKIRYWGYCYAPDYDPEHTPRTLGLPGKVFLSEAERLWRRQREEAQKPMYSIFQPPRSREVEFQKVSSTIRHQLEIFKPGSTCFIMTQNPLPIGTDRDEDGVNTRVERDKKLNPKNPDSDDDGISDGLELWSLKTDPTRRDTDGDAIIDGIEDFNRNGVHDKDETDPLLFDTDRDNMCDGDCRISEEVKLCNDNAGFDCIKLPYGYWRGEDRNLNGIVDKGEYDPRKPDSDDDGVYDDQEYFNCVLEQRKAC